MRSVGSGAEIHADRPIVIWLPTSTGNTQYADRLAEHTAAENWFSLEFDARWLEQTQPTIGRMAQQYADWIEVAPHQAIVCAGWGTGGLLAAEIAHILGERHPVGLLAIETAVPKPEWQQRPDDLATLAGAYFKHVALWQGIVPSDVTFPKNNDEDEMLGLLRSALRECIGAHPRGMYLSDLGQLRREFAVFRLHARAANHYRMPALPCPAVLAEVPDSARQGISLGWEPRMGDVHRLFLEGDHFDIMSAPRIVSNTRVIEQGLHQVVELMATQ